MLPLAPDPTLVRRYDCEGGRHVHDHAQVLFGIHGTLEVEVEGRGAWVDDTCGLIVPAGDTHTYCARRTAQVLVMDGLFGPATERMRRFALPPGWLGSRLDGDALLSALACAPTLGPRRPLDLAALAERLDADLSRRWTVQDLAATCCLSPQRLRARFTEALGVSPAAFVRARRLDRAEVLLRRGFALDAVASQVGYGQASALSAALRRERDTGARELRRRRAVLES